MKEFWRRSKVGFLAIFAQHCSNKHGRYLVVEKYGGGRGMSFIIVPESREGKGWSSFASVLRSALLLFMSFHDDGAYGRRNSGCSSRLVSRLNSPVEEFGSRSFV